MIASVSLLLVSIVAGTVLLWLFSKVSNQRAIRATKKRLQARLLEMRLYGDDPKVVVRAQRALLGENLRYFALMLRPAMFAMLPMATLLVLMEGFYGQRPIAPGEQSIVTVQLASLSSDSAAPEIQTPDGIVVETPPVRDLADNQVSWRIRSDDSASGEIRVRVGKSEAGKRVVTGEGFHYLVSRRGSSAFEWLLHPGEGLLPNSNIKWIEVAYPPAEISYFGWKTHWLVWFLIFSMVAAFLMKSRFHVTV